MSSNVTSGVVTCDEQRAFWVSWRGGALLAGAGEWTGSDVFLRWNDPEALRDIEAVSVSTEFGSEGFWEIRETEGTNGGNVEILL